MAPTGRTMSMMTKTHEIECCMCGDFGLSHLLFRCSLCHFRSQHSYCSNLYPKAESYKVCNWCLINKDNVHHHQRNNNLTISSLNNSDNKKLKQTNNHHNNSGPSPKWLQPTGPIKKPAIRSPPPSARKRTTEVQAQAQAQAQDQEEGTIRSARTSSVILRRSMSTSSIINVKMAKKMNSSDNNNNSKRLLENVNNNIRKKSEIRRGQKTSGGPTTNVMIKHVFRNKVRRYKLLDEVSC